MKQTGNHLKNETGLTLLEVLLSILILTILLISIMNIFPQIGKVNIQNKEKLETINLAKKELKKWQEDDDLKLFLRDPHAVNIPAYKGKTKDGHFYLFETTVNDYLVQLYVRTESHLDSKPSKVFAATIEFYDDTETKVTESFGYIVVEDMEMDD